ncbi:hypothetical protein [Propionivibrio sp.]|uniref:hypothetical protein n=1 Tax=Propionivibrio sp. TaxID=2212460 RepID=UPI003BF0383C
MNTALLKHATCRTPIHGICGKNYWNNLALQRIAAGQKTGGAKVDPRYKRRPVQRLFSCQQSSRVQKRIIALDFFPRKSAERFDDDPKFTHLGKSAFAQPGGLMDSGKPLLDHTLRCNGCVHYFITHELKFRYGCRALAFKSQQQPIRDVIDASGQSCLYFQARKQGHSDR